MPHYPLEHPGQPDRRFRWAMIRDVARVLVWYGYPDPLASARDASRLQRYLFRFLYTLRTTRGGGA